jgi:hypothetical protein
MSRDPLNPTIIGASPLGNNSVESTGNGDTPIEDTSVREVPLVFDSITGTWCAKLSKVNQEDRLTGLEIARLTNEDQTFLAKAGYIQS